MSASHSAIRPFFALLLALAAGALMLSCGHDDGDDRSPPQVNLLAQPATVNRTVTLSAEAGDDVSVASVDFLVDGAVIGTRTAPPYTLTWNTGTVADGARVLTAVARDLSGKSTTSTPVNVTVRNVVAFALTLSGSQEVPANNSAGTATGTITINLASGAVTGGVTSAGFTSTAAHIHDAFAGINGAILVGFTADTTTPGRWVPPASATLPAASIDRLLAGALYFNVHSAAFPGGEVRAQLVPAGTVVYFTDLSGLQELPAVTTTATARGAVTLNTATRLAQIVINTTGLDNAIGAHLHRGAAGSNGPIAIGLARDATTASRWVGLDVTVAQADFDLLQTAGTYLNVHTPANPGGEVRGAVVPPGFIVVVSRLTGDWEVPVARVTSARATVAVTVNTATGATDARINGTGYDDAIGAHLHDGFAGVNGPIIVNLEKDATTAGLWRSNGGTLTSTQIASLQQGGLYANVHTPAFPAGLIRGQLLPPNVELTLTQLSGAQEVPSIVTTASARGFTTVNVTSRSLTNNTVTTGLDNAIAAHVHTGARGVNGPVTVGLTKDATNTRWFANAVTLTEAQFASYRSGAFYLNVHTPANPGGEVRGQLDNPGALPP